jgi:hypothetical protein
MISDWLKGLPSFPVDWQPAKTNNPQQVMVIKREKYKIEFGINEILEKLKGWAVTAKALIILGLAIGLFLIDLID